MVLICWWVHRLKMQQPAENVRFSIVAKGFIVFRAAQIRPETTTRKAWFAVRFVPLQPICMNGDQMDLNHCSKPSCFSVLRWIWKYGISIKRHSYNRENDDPPVNLGAPHFQTNPNAPNPQCWTAIPSARVDPRRTCESEMQPPDHEIHRLGSLKFLGSPNRSTLVG